QRSTSRHLLCHREPLCSYCTRQSGLPSAPAIPDQPPPQEVGDSRHTSLQLISITFITFPLNLFATTALLSASRDHVSIPRRSQELRRQRMRNRARCPRFRRFQLR